MEAVQMAANSAAAAPTGEVSSPRWVNLIGGFATIILGLLLLAAPGATTAVLSQFLALYLLINGIIRLVSMFVDRSGWVWKLCVGVLGILAGLAMLQHPLWAAHMVPATVVLVIGILGIIIGIVQIFAGFRGAGWGAGLLGLAALGLGLLIILNPMEGVMALPYVLGIFALAMGIVSLVVSW